RAGVDLGSGAYIAPRHEVARIDEADHRFDRTRALLDILRGHGWGGGHGCSPVILSFVLIVPRLGALASVLALRSIKAAPRRLRHTLPEFEGETTMTYIPILALAPVILLAACGSADPEEVLETVRATEQAQSQAIAAKDLRGAVRNYADGAVLVVPGSPQATTGEAIAATYDAWLKIGRAHV